MKSLNYDKLAKILLLYDVSSIDEFIGEYVTENLNITNRNRYEIIVEVADILKEISEKYPELGVTGSFNIDLIEDEYYTISLYDLIENNNGELKVMYKTKFKVGE